MRHHQYTCGIEPIPAWRLPEVHRCLGDDVHSVVLHGSATLDDFCPRRSDVEVCVVLRSPVTPAQGDAVGDIHNRMYGRFVRGGAGRAGAWQSA